MTTSHDAQATSGVPDAGWIKHDGGPCPVALETKVEVRTREGTSADEIGQADWFVWWHNGGPADIIAYRIAEPTPSDAGKGSAESGLELRPTEEEWKAAYDLAEQMEKRGWIRKSACVANVIAFRFAERRPTPSAAPAPAHGSETFRQIAREAVAAGWDEHKPDLAKRIREGKADDNFEVNAAPLAADALSSHVAAQGQVVVGIKPLEWVEPNGLGSSLQRADTIVGSYRVWTHHEANGKWFWHLDGKGVFGDFTVASRAEGISAAQADYEMRIRSALATPPPPSVGEPGEEELPVMSETLRALFAIAEGYHVTTWDDRFISVENPDFRPDDGSDPNLVIDTWAVNRILRGAAQVRAAQEGERG